jgi:TRAP-type C4-dicarboxylate transport system permease small subunit
MTRALDGLFTAAAILAAILLATIAALTLAEIVGRFFGVLMPAGTEFGGFAMAASIFLGLGWTLRNGGHIRVNLVLQRLSERARRPVEIWCLVFAAVVVAVMAYGTAHMVMNSFNFGSLGTGLVPVPLWIPQLSMVIGVVLLEVAIIEQLVILLRGGVPTYRRLEDESLGLE